MKTIKQKEDNMKKAMKKTIMYNGNLITVDRHGNVFYNDVLLKQYQLAGGKYSYVVVYDKNTCNKSLISVARAVAMAFVGCPGNFNDYQVDHKDNDTYHNVPCNLRWVSRKWNNSRRHAKSLKSKNAHHVSHKDQVIVAKNTTTNDELIFENGYRCAEALGCSHVLVYNALNENMPHVKTAKGWTLRWAEKNV